MLNQEGSRTPSSQGDPGSANQGAFSQWNPDMSAAPRDGTPALILMEGDTPIVGTLDGAGWWITADGQGWNNNYATHWAALPPMPNPATP